MNRGILVFARNNDAVDYILQARDLAKRADKYLDLPVSLVTDEKSLADQDLSLFDKVITVETTPMNNYKTFYDGSGKSVKTIWKNDARTLAFDLTPYEETILLDTDVVICNSNFLQCFEHNNDFLIYKDCFNLVNMSTGIEFSRISNISVDFFWATCIFFRKTKVNKIFFDLLQHIQDEWHHYRKTYVLDTHKFRNDYVFSIGIHIMNGFTKGEFAKPMPGTLYYITDKSILYKMNDNNLKFLLEKPTYSNEYTFMNIKNANVHVMNKFSLERCINEQ